MNLAPNIPAWQTTHYIENDTFVLSKVNRSIAIYDHLIFIKTKLWVLEVFRSKFVLMRNITGIERIKDVLCIDPPHLYKEQIGR